MYFWPVFILSGPESEESIIIELRTSLPGSCSKTHHELLDFGAVLRHTVVMVEFLFYIFGRNTKDHLQTIM
mgnify:CR=1 FL=1